MSIRKASLSTSRSGGILFESGENLFTSLPGVFEPVAWQIIVSSQILDTIKLFTTMYNSLDRHVSMDHDLLT